MGGAPGKRPRATHVASFPKQQYCPTRQPALKFLSKRKFASSKQHEQNQRSVLYQRKHAAAQASVIEDRRYRTSEQLVSAVDRGRQQCFSVCVFFELVVDPLSGGRLQLVKKQDSFK